jgi:hypothetical protein
MSLFALVAVALVCAPAQAQTWTLHARSDGTALMSSWTAGMGTASSANYIAPCGTYLQWGDSVVLRITMGSVTDYFRPNAGLDLCGMCSMQRNVPSAAPCASHIACPSAMLNSYSRHRWSYSLSVPFVRPDYYNTHTGGSAFNWPTSVSGTLAPGDQRCGARAGSRRRQPTEEAAAAGTICRSGAGWPAHRGSAAAARCEIARTLEIRTPVRVNEGVRQRGRSRMPPARRCGTGPMTPTWPTFVSRMRSR